MLKKLYYLDNEEKNRILNLHENRSKRQYLTVLKQELNTLSENVDKTYFLGVSPDEKIFFTNKNLYVNESDELKKLEYDLDSLPYILETARKKCDKMLVEGNITLNKYLSIPQKFLMSLMEEWGINNGVRHQINEHWNDKFKDSLKLLTENRKLIFENGLNYQLWEEVNLICNQIIVEQGWNPLSKDFVGYKAAKAVGSAIQKGAQTVIKGISKASNQLLNWVLKKGIIPALRWIRRNLNSYIGMITEIIASMFPTVVVVKAIWGMIVILDIYEILYNDFDPKDPDRAQMPFLFLMTDIVTLLFTSAVGAGSKAAFKTAIKQGGATGSTKNLLKQLIDKLPSLKGSLENVKGVLQKLFGNGASGFINTVFNGLGSIIDKLLDFIKKTFSIKEMGKSIGKTVKELPTKAGAKKLAIGSVLGGGIAWFFSENSLKKGSEGNLVKQAQNALIILQQKLPQDLNYSLKVTGIYDDSTVNAVKQVQSFANKLQPELKVPEDGIMKPDFAAALTKMTGVTIDLGLSKIGLLNTDFFKGLSGGFGQIMMGINNQMNYLFGGLQGTLSNNKK
jgi:hypothetical protein